MDGERQRYLSYLLRLWQVSGRTWRASLQSPDGGERVGFPSLEELFEFLREQTAVEPSDDGTEGDIESSGERREG
jgi:hypothetical protein